MWCHLEPGAELLASQSLSAQPKPDRPPQRHGLACTEGSCRDLVQKQDINVHIKPTQEGTRWDKKFIEIGTVKPRALPDAVRMKWPPVIRIV